MSVQEKVTQENVMYHTGTDGKQYPDPTPKEYDQFGAAHRRALMQYEPEQYQALIVAGGLNAYLSDVERQAQEELEQIVQAMAQKDGTDEALKARDPMKWVRLMNNYRHCAAEIVRQNWS